MQNDYYIVFVHSIIITYVGDKIVMYLRRAKYYYLYLQPRRTRRSMACYWNVGILLHAIIITHDMKPQWKKTVTQRSYRNNIRNRLKTNTAMSIILSTGWSKSLETVFWLIGINDEPHDIIINIPATVLYVSALCS